MDEFRDLMAARVTADADGESARGFASAFGDAVVARVRRRRRVRAASTAGASALAVGLLAVGVVAIPPVFEPAQPGPSAGACVESPWPRVTGPDGHIVSGASEIATFTLSVDSLQVDSGGSTVNLAVNDGILEGTSASGEERSVELPSGEVLTVALVWNDNEIAVTVGTGPDEEFTASTQRYADQSAVDLDRRYHGIDVSTVYDATTWYLWDDAANSPALTVALAGPGQFTVTAPDGTMQTFALGDDGVATVDWSGQVVAAMDMSDDSSSRSVQIDRDVTSPVDGTVTAAAFCLPAPLAGEDGATDASLLASQAPIASGAQSPFECGYRLPSLEAGDESWRIEQAEWLDRAGAYSSLQAWYSDPVSTFLAEAEGPVAHAAAGGDFLSGSAAADGPGESGIVRPGDTDSGSQLLVAGFDTLTSEMLSFVATVDGVVVATPSPGAASDGQIIVDRDDDSAPQEAFLIDEGALVACPGAEAFWPDPDAQIVAVAGVAARVGTALDGPVYAWQTLPTQP